MERGMILALLLVLLFESGESGTACPNMKSLYPCFCSSLQDGTTLVICPGIQNTSHLEQVTKPLKSLIVDRLILLDTFPKATEEQGNSIFPEEKNRKFPKKWLAELRVRELDILYGNLHSCFLCDDALEGQSDFLVSITAKQAGLRGHVCSTCNAGNQSVSTRELRRTPRVSSIDFSHNEIEFLDGNSFPSTLIELKKIVLSNNRISRVYDGALANLHQLNEVDLSKNLLVSVTRKMFRPVDSALKTLDLSYNSIQTLPEDMFLALNGLKEVKLSHNLLETLPANTWSRIPTLLDRVDLRGNFLVCNCTMNWMQRRLSKTTKVLAVCVAPKEVVFQELKSTMPSINTNC